MKLSEEAKAIKQVPEGFCCTIKGYRRLYDFVCKEYLPTFKEYTDEDIKDMIRVETRLARRGY